MRDAYCITLFEHASAIDVRCLSVTIGNGKQVKHVSRQVALKCKQQQQQQQHEMQTHRSTLSTVVVTCKLSMGRNVCGGHL